MPGINDETNGAEGRLTDDLLRELIASSDPSEYLASNEAHALNLSYLLADLLAEKHLRKSDCIRRSGLNETFAYQIFSGDRHPGRDKALQLAFAFPLDLKETNRLLKYAGVNELYCRDRRDAIIIFCVTHGYTLQQTDDELYRFGEKTILREQ